MIYFISVLLLFTRAYTQDFFSLRVGEKHPPLVPSPPKETPFVVTPPFFSLRNEEKVLISAPEEKKFEEEKREERKEEVAIDLSKKLSEFYTQIITRMEKRLMSELAAFQKRSEELKEAIDKVNEEIKEKMEELGKRTEEIALAQREYREDVFETLRMMEERNTKRMRLIGIASSSFIVLMSTIAIIFLLRRKVTPAPPLSPIRKSTKKGEVKEFEDVHRLHEQGYSIEEIAKHTKLSKGEIELILGLRRR